MKTLSANTLSQQFPQLSPLIINEYPKRQIFLLPQITFRGFLSQHTPSHSLQLIFGVATDLFIESPPQAIANISNRPKIALQLIFVLDTQDTRESPQNERSSLCWFLSFLLPFMDRPTCFNNKSLSHTLTPPYFCLPTINQEGTISVPATFSQSFLFENNPINLHQRIGGRSKDVLYHQSPPLEYHTQSPEKVGHHCNIFMIVQYLQQNGITIGINSWQNNSAPFPRPLTGPFQSAPQITPTPPHTILIYIHKTCEF